jgi:putative transposase
MQEIAMTKQWPGCGEKVVNRGGSPAALTPHHILVLHEIVARMPHATLDELAAELDHLGEVRVCTVTICRKLRAQGIVRSMPVP